MFEHEDGYKKIKERVGEGTVIFDDPNSLELEELVEEYSPDIILSGVKEKYLAHKLGVPCVLIHSYENGPYIGFEGFLNLTKDIYAAIYNPVWKFLEFKDEIKASEFEEGILDSNLENGVQIEGIEVEDILKYNQKGEVE
jgi:nitrogenase molybdenum-iron protein alpha chain